jgi:hypothetical protein
MPDIQGRLPMGTQPFQFALIRHVQDVARDEPTNVGVLVRSIDGTQSRLRFASPTAAVWRSVRPEMRDLVRHLEQQLGLAARGERPFGRIGFPTDSEFLLRARAEFSGHIQFSDPRGFMGDGIDSATEAIFRRYVAARRGTLRTGAAAAHPAIAPSRLRQRVLSTFKRYRLLRRGGVQQSFAVRGEHAKWTFDLGYENGALNLINSVALNSSEPSTNLSRALVFKGMVDEVRKSADKRVHGTAVTAAGDSASTGASANEAQQILRDAKIEVVPLAQLPQLINRVRDDLRPSGARRG